MDPRAEEHAPEHAVLLRALDAAADAVVRLDRSLRPVWLNRAARERLDRSVPDLLDRPVWRVWPNPDLAPFGAAVRRAVATGAPELVEDFVPVTSRWYELEAIPDASGCTVLVRDVTDRRRRDEGRALWERCHQRTARVTSLTGTLGEILRELRSTTGADAAELWTCDDRPRTTPRLVRTVTGDDGDTDPSGDGRGMPPDPGDDPSPRWVPLADAAPVRGALEVPLRTGGHTFAVVRLLTRGGPERDDWLAILRRMHPVLQALVERQRARHEFERVFEMTGDLVCIAGLDGRIHRVNPQLVHTLGLSTTDVEGDLADSLVVPDDLDRWRTALRRAAGGREVREVEVRSPAADGTDRILSWTISGSPDEGLLVANARDVTRERRQARFEAAQREILRGLATGTHVDELLADLLDATCERVGVRGTLLLVADPLGAGMRCVASAGFDDDLVAALAGVVGDGRDAVGDPGWWPSHRAVARRHGLHPYASAVLPDQGGAFAGRLMTYVTRSTPVATDTYRVVADVARLASLVIEHRRTAERLTASEERFRFVAQVTTDAVWDWDAVADRLWWSEGFRHLFGLEAGEMVAGHTWEQHIHPDDRATTLESLEAALTGRNDTWDREYRFLRADGEVAIVFDRARILRDAQGRAVRMIGGMSDLTERRRREQQHLRTQRLESIGTLAGGVAHDLNNVLTPIVVASDLLLETVASPADREMATMIRESAQRGAEMVQQVLLFARGVEGERRPVTAAALLTDVRRLLRDVLPKSIDLEVVVADDAPVTLGDATQLQQVLVNLALNGRDAMPDGGTLTIGADRATLARDSSAPASDWLRLQVRDTGTGIRSHDLEHVFEPFFTTKDVGQGTGLGLSTSLAIVTSHGGTLEVHSGPESGATFEVLLPAETGDGPVETRPRTPAHRDGDGQLVLVVDDEEAVRLATCRTLERHGYRTLAAVDGHDGLRTWERAAGEVDLVVTDLMMPGCGGLELARTMRDAGSTLPIVAISGVVDPDRIEEATTAGVSLVLPKPFASDDLLHIVARALTTAGPD